MIPKIAIINGGLHHDTAFKWLAEKKHDAVYVGRLDRTDIFLYDILIIPFHTDQIALLKNQSRFEEFVRSGGVLVVLGATQEGRKWLPFFDWEEQFTETLSLHRSMPDGKPNPDAEILFSKITDERMLKYHGIYTAHGSLLLDSGQEGLTVLATGENKRVILAIKRLKGKGSLLCTTLDPDFHSVSSVPGPNAESTAVTHQKARLFLGNIVRWAIQEAKSKPVALRKKRQQARKKAQIFRWAKFGLVFIVPFIVSIYLLYLQYLDKIFPDNKLYSYVISFVGILGSLVSIWQWFYDRRIEQRY